MKSVKKELLHFKIDLRYGMPDELLCETGFSYKIEKIQINDQNYVEVTLYPYGAIFKIKKMVFSGEVSTLFRLSYPPGNVPDPEIKLMIDGSFLFFKDKMSALLRHTPLKNVHFKYEKHVFNEIYECIRTGLDKYN
jgi:hypothetical protein